MSSLCGPCVEGSGKKIPAVNWCVSCEEYLCEDCVGHHRSLKLTRNHYLTDLLSKDHETRSAVAETGTGSRSFDHGTCNEHPQNEVKFFCIDHDTLLCDVCANSSHYKCSRNVIPIDIAAKGTKSNPQFGGLKNEIEAMMHTLINTVASTRQTEQNVICQAGLVREKLYTTKRSFLKCLDFAEQSLHEELDAKEREILQRLQSERSTAEDGQKMAAKMTDELISVLNNGSDREAFILMQTWKSFRAGNKLKDGERSYLQNLNLQLINTADPSALENCFRMQFGNIVIGPLPLQEQFSHVMQLTPQPHTTHAMQVTPQPHNTQTFGSINKLQKTINTGKFVLKMSINDSGQVVLLELNVVSSSRVYLYDDNENKLAEVKFSESPTDVAALPGGSRVALLADEKEIIFLNMKSQTREEKTITMSHGCNVIAASIDLLYVGIKDEIIVMNFEGKFLRSMKISGMPVQALCPDQNGDVYYAVSDIVYCMKECGEEINVYRTNNRDLREITGIALDIQGNIYISGRKSKNIHMLKKSNGLAEIILKKENGIKKPKGICIDKLRSKLFVHYGDYSPIQVYSS